MPLNHPIAIGATAEVYSWNDGQVLKLFNPGVSGSSVEYEANLTRIVYATGLSVPAAGEIIEIDGRFGLVYERIEGVSMLEALMKQPWKFSVYAHQLAELQADMHKRRVPEMPSQVDRLRRKIGNTELLPQDIRQAALKALERMPEEDTLCHGDFHPGNIILTSRGPVIIDWLDATRGSPLVDVARSVLLMGGGQLPPDTPHRWLVSIWRRWFTQVYLWRYFQLRHGDRQELDKWVSVNAAARLSEEITVDDERLLSIAQRLVS